MTQAVLSLGSNLGDRAGYLHAAVDGLGDLVLAVSGVYETPAWGGSGPAGETSPPYLNAVVLAVDGEDDARVWLDRARALEQAGGRHRDRRWRFQPRTLDIDVITVCTADGAPVISGDPELTLPHPRAHLRAFVLRPWLDVQPYARLPGHGWVYDLVRSAPIAQQLHDLRPCPDIRLDPR